MPPPRRFTDADFAVEQAPAEPAAAAPRKFTDADFQEPPGIGESVLRGGAQGLTLGSAEEVQAYVRTAAEQLKKDLHEGIPFEPASFLDPTGGVRSVLGLPGGEAFTESYVPKRDEYRARDQAAAAWHPGFYHGAELVSAAALPLGAAGLGARGAAAGASLGARALAGAAAAAPIGAVAGFGGSTADLTKGEYGKAALDTAIGAGTAGLLGAAAPVAGALARGAGRAVRGATGNLTSSIQQAAGKLPGAQTVQSIAGGAQRWLARLSDPNDIEARAAGQALKAAGMQNVSVMRRVGDLDDQIQLGTWLLDKRLPDGRGIIDKDIAISRPEIQKRIASMVKQAGDDIGQIRKIAASAGLGPRAASLDQKIAQAMHGMDLGAFEPMSSALQLINIGNQMRAVIAKNAQPNGRIAPEFLDKMKSWMDTELRTAYGNQQHYPEPAEALRLAIRTIFKKEEERVVSGLSQGGQQLRINGQPILQKFVQAKEDYGNGLDLLHIGGIQNMRDLSNLGLGLREAGLLGMAAMGSNPVTGVALVAGKRLGDEFGNATAALALSRRAANLRTAQPAAVGAAQPAAGAIALPPAAAAPAGLALNPFTGRTAVAGPPNPRAMAGQMAAAQQRQRGLANLIAGGRARLGSRAAVPRAGGGAEVGELSIPESPPVNRYGPLIEPAAPETPAAMATVTELPSRISRVLENAQTRGPQAAAAAAMFLIREHPELRDQIIEYVRGFGSGPEPIAAQR